MTARRPAADGVAARTPRRRVAVLHGGVSRERDVSLASGRAVATALTRAGFDVLPVEVDRDGAWRLPHAPVSALPALDDAATGERALGPPVPPAELPVDVVFVALHGEFGEDGKVQGLLELAGLPYTGSGVDASALAMDKVRTKEVLAHHGLRTAPWIVVESGDWIEDPDDVLERVARDLGYPVVVKPPRDGSSFGLSLADDPDALRRDVAAMLAEPGARALLERRIVGTEVSCPVLGNHGGPLRSLPIVEIIPAHGGLFDFAAKYEGASAEICPARIDEDVASRVRAASVLAHRVLRCDGVSRSDFIVDADGVPWFLETNTIPGMTPASLCPLSAKTAGIEFDEFCALLVELAVQRGARRTRT